MPSSQSAVSGVANIAKPGSALDRALRKHHNRNSGDADPNANLTYQEVPVALVDDEDLQAEQKAQRARQTVQDELHYDESLFLDKIKGFSLDQTANLPAIDE